MTQVVTVQTDFADLNQMTQGLMDRVHETHVILTGPDDIPEGDWVQFAILLNDGASGLAGLGRCVRAVDNGEARQPHQRFDLVLDSLQFDQHGHDVFQYILMSRQAMQDPAAAATYAEQDDEAEYDDAGDEAEYADDYAGGEAEYADAGDDAADVDDEAAYAAAAHGDGAQDEGDDYEEATSLRDPDALFADAAGEAAPDFASQAEAPRNDSFEPVDMEAVSVVPHEVPAAPPAPVLDGERRFIYAGGLPLPSAPPRPSLDPSLRVTPAPRPSANAATHAVDAIDPYEASRAEAQAASPIVIEDDGDDDGDEFDVMPTEPPRSNGMSHGDEGLAAPRAVELEDDSTSP